jgi:MFS family permease
MTIQKKQAFFMIVLFGVISLFGDILYEGARGVNGPYLKTLGASAASVGLIVGIAELLGYAIRLVSGFVADKTRAHWYFMIAGYGMLIAVPLLSLANIWQTAALFIAMERIGKGLRSPARDTLVSHASRHIGTGLGFGISEFIDQIGAVAGPLLFAAALAAAHSQTIAAYQSSYTLFWIPFILMLAVIFFVFGKYKKIDQLEDAPEPKQSTAITKTFWLYVAFTVITTSGFASFALIGYHLKQHHIFSDVQIPILYAFAMAIDAVAGLFIGKMYDVLKVKYQNHKAGLLLLIMLPVATAAVPFLTFSLSASTIIIGTFLWGIVMGAHDTIMKSAIADITSIKKRATGYGLFNVCYGAALFVGSTLCGVLYDFSIPLLMFTLAGLQIVSLPVFFVLKKQTANNKT